MRNSYSVCVNELNYSFICSQSHNVLGSFNDSVTVFIKILIDFWKNLDMRLKQKIFTFLCKQFFFHWFDCVKSWSRLFRRRLFQHLIFMLFKFFFNISEHFLSSWFCKNFECWHLFFIERWYFFPFFILKRLF